MRLIIGKKPTPEKRDNNGLTIRHKLAFSPDFPEWLMPSKTKLLEAMEMIQTKKVRYHELESITVWEKQNDEDRIRNSFKSIKRMADKVRRENTMVNIFKR
jgi:hypothetical protein